MVIEISLGSNVRLTVSGPPDREELARAVKNALEVVQQIGEETALPLKTPLKRKGIPEEVVRHVDEMSNKEVVLTLLHFEGPMSKDGIKQRSREIGKEVKDSWLDKNMYREMEGLIISENSPEGTKLYRLTEKGRIEAEKLFERLGIL